MKTIITAVVLVLFACYWCLFPSRALAQNPAVLANHPLDFNGQRQTSDAVDAGQDQDILSLGGRVVELERQRNAVRSARDAVARARIGKLEDRVQALEEARARLPADLVGRAEVVVMINDAIKAASGSQPSFDGPAGTDPPVNPAAATDLNLDQKLREVELNLSGQISGLQVQIDAINNRLSRRTNRFDAGAFGLVARGFNAVGASFGALWPFGDEGEWMFRLAGGVGQGWTNFEGRDALLAPALLVETDVLYQLGDDIRFGPYLAGVGGIGGTEGLPFSYLFYGAGAAFRWQVGNWAALQFNTGPGVALGSFHRELSDSPGEAFLEVLQTWSATAGLYFTFP